MSDPRALTPDACEILVARELRRAGIAPVGLRRTQSPDGADGWRFDLIGRLEAYGRRWSTLIECRATTAGLHAMDVDAVRRRADSAGVASVLMFAGCAVATDAVARAEELRVAVLRVVDARAALLAAGRIERGPLPAWAPELTVELLELADGGIRARLLEPDQPEPVLQQLRRHS